MNGCKLGWFRIPHRLHCGVCCEKEREGPEQPRPIDFRQSWPAFFQKESGHRINRAHQSGASATALGQTGSLRKEGVRVCVRARVCVCVCVCASAAIVIKILLLLLNEGRLAA